MVTAAGSMAASCTKNITSKRQTISKGIFYQIQVDLADMASLKHHNSHFTFILTAIDVFSRFAFAIPIKRKTGKEVVRALHIIFQQSPEIKLVQSDQGKEFLNQDVYKFLQSKGATLFYTNSGMKASIVERFNRTLKTYMFRYFTANHTLRYIDILQDLVNAYNNRVHRSLGVAPVNVTSANERVIRKKLYGETFKKHRKKAKAIFSRNDRVRIAKQRGIFTKGYLPKFSKDIYTVRLVRYTYPPTYYLKDKNEINVIGAFYENELVRVFNG